ncbi:glycoside hydrolase family 3 N-terminal domain-containing protein [Arthrobacter sp. NPDC056691]|uniref:glycoside hydrolase family 3 N-terminal domain-containing protein n=1 Tax=Arthrobacter sp. NPDC056691 TaxID=3345913 RepID=UPI00366CE1DC
MPQTDASSPAPSAAKPAPRETAALGWGPQQRDADAAAAAVAKMTLEEKAGQVLLPFYTGLDHEAQAATIERLHLAGSMIMADNVPGTATGLVDVPGLAGVTRRLDKAARSGGRTWPGLIGVDQEGGAVSRVGAPLTRWPTPMSYGAAGSVPLAAEAGTGLAAELAPLGFTVDFAPAADVTMGPADPTIGARSMSADARAAASLSAGFARGMLAGGVLPTVKHFPGHGSVTADSHKGLPVQNASLAQLKARDWKPFQSAVKAGAPMIMTGHIAARALDPGVPASLSKATYRALRGLGFKGVAVTDGLNMGAVAGRYPLGSAAPAALAAGADLLLMPADAAAAHAAVVRAVTEGKLPPARLEDAARRVVTMMIWRGRTAQPKPAAAPGSGEALSARISARAITVVAGLCKGASVRGSVRVEGGTPVDRARFAAAAKEAGITLGTTGPLVSLISYGAGPTKGDVAVALDAPWPLAQSVAPTKIALYGRTPGAYKALLAVLAGKATAPGKLPAAVGPYRPGTGCR